MPVLLQAGIYKCQETNSQDPNNTDDQHDDGVLPCFGALASRYADNSKYQGKHSATQRE